MQPVLHDESVPAEGMMPVPYVSGPGEGTDLSEIESPRWGPGWLLVAC